MDRLECRDRAFTPPVTEASPFGYQQLIRAFNAFVDTKIDEGDPIHGDWQNKAIKTEFDEFRLAGFARYTPKQVPTSSMATSGGHTGGSTSLPHRVRDPVFEFKKGIKRDPASFTVLKDNKQWDSVHRTLKAQTNYQDVADVLDPSYVPRLAEDIALFEEKQKYMYAVFERTLLSDKGKALVREHTIDYDAQTVFKDLSAYALQSNKATLDSSSILTYITSSQSW